MNQTCRTLLEKSGQAHKWCTSMDPFSWQCKSRAASLNLHTAALWGYRVYVPEVMNYREGWRERVRDICADGMTTWWWWMCQGKLKIYLTFYNTKVLSLLKIVSLQVSSHKVSVELRWVMDRILWAIWLGCRIPQLHLCRGVRLLKWVSWILTLNNLIVRFQ